MQASPSNTNLPAQEFDYIIAGAGCAGLSLLMRMMKHPFFSAKQILVIDEFPKTKNDRTWCFWEKENGLFESIVYKKWPQINFYSNSFSSNFSIAPYQYKMIRSIDFYTYVMREAKKHPNIHFHFLKASSVGNEAGKAFAIIENRKVYADYLFNSIFFNREMITPSSQQPGKHYLLLQHFKGWLIETAEDIFETGTATFMDFRISQQQGTAFVYMLPVAANKALVEYTLFTENILEQEEYNAALNSYISKYITDKNFVIEEEEYGIIPMTNYPFPKREGNIIQMGAAGGQTKASSGFTFQFIQKHSTLIIQSLIRGKMPHGHRSFSEKKFNLYDSTLLNVLSKKKLGGDEIFTRLFKKNPPQRILSFLDNETGPWQDLAILSSVPSFIFLPAALKEFWNTVKA